MVLLSRQPIPPHPGLLNLASEAKIQASSSGFVEGSSTRSSPDAVIDGTDAPWVSDNGGPGEWLFVTFQNVLSMNTIYLYDRGDPQDQIASGQLAFSDGSFIAFGPLNNDGSATIITFNPPVHASAFNFTINGVSPSTTQIGLAELQVYYDPDIARPGTLPVDSPLRTTLTKPIATDTGLLSATLTDPFLRTPSVAVSPGGSLPSSPNNDGDNPLRSDIVEVIIGSVIGGIAILLLLILVLFFLIRRRKRRRNHGKPGRMTEGKGSTLTRAPKERITSASALSSHSTAASDEPIYFDPQALYDLTPHNPRRLSTIPSSHFFPDSLPESGRTSRQSFRSTMSMNPGSSLFTNSTPPASREGRRSSAPSPGDLLTIHERAETAQESEQHNPFAHSPPRASTGRGASRSRTNSSRRTSLTPTHSSGRPSYETPPSPTSPSPSPPQSPIAIRYPNVKRKPVPSVEDLPGTAV